MKGRVVTTDTEINAAIARAEHLGNEILAVSARYVPAYDIFILSLTNNTRLVLQREKLQGLRNATRTKLANVHVEMLGTSLSWPDLDVDLYVPALLKGIYGTKKWMSELGRLGGSVKSEAKTNAAKRNGLKGGRPPKHKTVAKNLITKDVKASGGSRLRTLIS